MTDNVLGIPVIRDPLFTRVAEARGIFRKRIVVGPKWDRLPMDERIAVLYHEAGHCIFRHYEKRLLVVPLLLLGFDFPVRLARAQEIECDALARRFGYGPALTRLLRREPENDSIFYPSHDERVAALEA